MRSYCTDYLATMPDITVYINCDTRLAINLNAFELGDYDEFIFAIKNHSYVESPYVFLFRARKQDMDAKGEILFKITPTASKQLKPGAFYNFAVLANAFDPKVESEYRKLTANGNILLEYGAQDIVVKTELSDQDYDIASIRLEEIEASEEPQVTGLHKSISGIRLEMVE